MRRRSALADSLRRFCAAGGAALVLALAVFSASPQLHDWLHEGGAAHDDDCAIALFAGGIAVSLGGVAIAAPTAAWREPAPVAAAEIFVAAPRYLLMPERGPPVS